MQKLTMCQNQRTLCANKDRSNQRSQQ